MQLNVNASDKVINSDGSIYSDKSGVFTEAWDFKWVDDGWKLINVEQVSEDFYSKLADITAQIHEFS